MYSFSPVFGLDKAVKRPVRTSLVNGESSACVILKEKKLILKEKLYKKLKKLTAIASFDLSWSKRTRLYRQHNCEQHSFQQLNALSTVVGI